MATPPDRCKDPIVASTLNAAYQEMQQKGLAVVPSSLTSHAMESYQMTVLLGRMQTTWDLVKVAKQGKQSCIKDGINDDRKSLENPVSIVQEVTRTAPKLVNCNKTKRRKKTKAVKDLQLRDPRLFCVQQNKAKVKSGADVGDPEEIAAWWRLIEQKEAKKQKKREKKHKSKKTGRKKKQKTREEPKKGKKRYRHLQEFIEKRRQKKLQRKCTLDLSAQVAIYDFLW